MRPPRELTPSSASGSRPPIRSRLPVWARLSPFARDISVVLVVKVVVLWFLWFAFFHAPAAPRMMMDPQRVEQKLLGPSAHPEPPHAVR